MRTNGRNAFIAVPREIKPGFRHPILIDLARYEPRRDEIDPIAQLRRVLETLGEEFRDRHFALLGLHIEIVHIGYGTNANVTLERKRG